MQYINIYIEVTNNIFPLIAISAFFILGILFFVISKMILELKEKKKIKMKFLLKIMWLKIRHINQTINLMKERIK